MPPESVTEYVLTFDGQDDWIELPPVSIPSGNAITCSFWAYGGEALPKANSVIGAWCANNQGILNIHLIWSDSYVYFDCGSNKTEKSESYDRIRKQINAADCKGKWSHWAFTKNATTGAMKIYFNGELWHQETGKNIPIPQTAKARLGSYFNSHYYPGRLAEVQLWNRERTQAEIQQDLPRRLRGDEPGLVSYWPLNEGSGTIAHDKTSNAHHGIIYGNPRWEISTLSLLPAPPNPTENPTTPVNTPIDSQTKSEYILTFDGQDDLIELPPASIPSGNELTCSFWAYGGEALPRANSVIEAWSANNQRILNVHLIWNNSCIYFDCGNSGASFDSYDRLMKPINAADCKGKWSHWAFTKNATTGNMKIYLNGNLWHQETNKTISIPQAAKARLGCSLNSQYYPGKLAEFQLWNRERSQAEIQQDMSRRLRGDEPGLVSYWSLKESSGTIAHDKTSNAYHGTIYGNPRWEISTLSLVPALPNQTQNPPTPVNTPMDSEKKPGAPIESTEYALAFDGSTTYIEIPSNSGLDLRNDFTLEAWVRPKRLAGIQRILSKASAYGFGLRGDQVRFTTYGKQDYDTTQAKLSVDTWTHLAVFVDTNNTAHFYVNSVMVQAVPGKGPANQSSVPLMIGRLGSGLECLAGQIAEVRLWKGARPEEIQADPSRRLKGDEPGLVGYWLLNEGQGAIVHDRTSFANHGTIQGNVNWEISALALAPVSPKPSEKLIPEADTPMITQIGPAGSTIAATEFVIQPRSGTPASRIKGISLSSGWAVDKIQVQYENSATNPAEIYYSQAFGGGEGSLKPFFLAPGDYLTSVSGTWGSQAPGYPKTEIVSLQFHTHQGMQSQIFGGENPQKQVEPFTLVVPEGSEIIGFFGAYGGSKNLLVRVGIYTRPHTSQNEEVSNLPQNHQNMDVKPTVEYALNFDGQNDFITCPNGMVSPSYTKEAWVKLAEPILPSNNILSGTHHALYLPHGWLQAGHNGQWAQVKDSHVSPANTWFHAAVTYDSQSQVMCLYRDGRLVSQASNVPPFNPSDSTLQIGSHVSSYFFKGQIAEARVWNKVLSETEIQSNLSRRLVGNEPGLVAYWPLNEESGAIAHDKTSGAYHGNIYGNPRWETSTLSLVPAPPNQTQNPTTPVNTPMDSEKKPGAPIESTEYALAFDGSTTCIEIPSNNGLDLRNDFTLEAWVRPKRLAGIQRILSKASAYGFGLRGDQVRFTTYGKQDYDTTQAKLSVDTWTHLAVFVDTDNTAHIYVNSVMVQALPGKGPANQSSAPLMIGRLGTGLEHFAGQIAEVRIWKGARPVEIQADPSRRLKGDEPGLVAYWLLNEGQGAIVHDKTSFANHGTIQGNVNWEISALSLAPVSPKPSETTIQEIYTPMITQIGPAGSTIAATEFIIQPRIGTPASRIKGISLSSGGAVDKIQVQYENSATNPAEIYYSQAFGGGGGGLTTFSIAPGDYLTSITGTWGAQAAGYPREEIISLQFHTHQGNHSQVFGGANPQKQVEPFTLVAREGSEIIGLFGAYGSHQNALVRLGLYTQPVQSATGTPQINPTVNPPTDSTQPGVGNQGQLQLETAVPMFDGQTNYIEIPHHSGLGLTNNFTVEAWFKAQTLSGYRRICSKFPGFGYGLVDNSLLFTTYWLQDYTATVQLIPGTWYHLAVVFDVSNTAHFYLNGELVKTVEGELPATLAIGTLEIGRKAEARDEYFHGQLAEIRIWSKARTAAAIQAGKSYRLVGDEPNLVGYWPLNEGSGTMVYDKSSHANHGIIRGDAVWSISPLKVSAAELNPYRDKVAEVIPQQVITLPTTGEQETVSIPQENIPGQTGTAGYTEVSPPPIIIEMEPQTAQALDEFLSHGDGVIYDSVHRAVAHMKAQGTIATNVVPVFVVISEPVATIAKKTTILG